MNKRVTVDLLNKYYQLGADRAGSRMAKETSISIQICLMFLDAPTFRAGLDVLKKFYIWIYDERQGRSTNDY
jgi:hypothetical protein